MYKSLINVIDFFKKIHENIKDSNLINSKSELLLRNYNSSRGFNFKSDMSNLYNLSGNISGDLIIGRIYGSNFREIIRYKEDVDKIIFSKNISNISNTNITTNNADYITLY